MSRRSAFTLEQLRRNGRVVREGETTTEEDPNPHPWPVQHIVTDERHLITVPWLLALEQFGRKRGAAGGGVFQRTLLVKDSTVGDDIADHVTVYEPGTAGQFVGVLRKVITDDLTVRVKKNGTALVTLTIPAATAIDTPVATTAFTAGEEALLEGDVLTWDITESDNSRDRYGVASFTLEWK